MDNRNLVALSNQPSKNRVRKTNRKSSAAKWNIKTLAELEAALKMNPEADITALLSTTYSEKLQSFKKLDLRYNTIQGQRPKPVFPHHDIRSRLSASDASTFLFGPSIELQALLGDYDNLSEILVNLLDESEVLYKSAWAASVMVFRVSPDIAVKITCENNTKTEYQTLLYLYEHLPSFPAPRGYGIARLGHYYLIFTTFISGIDLEKAWPELDITQKQSIRSQLDGLLSKLRSLPFPENTPLGGIQGGCRDRRQDERINIEPIINVKQFEDFIFAGSRTASPLYTKLLRQLTPTTSTTTTTCVFTHGDIRPANIMVEKGSNSSWTITAIIDWEVAGFYPEYWESIKMTNNLTPSDIFDWYEYLPESISMSAYPIQWLVDRLWDLQLVNR